MLLHVELNTEERVWQSCQHEQANKEYVTNTRIGLKLLKLGLLPYVSADLTWTIMQGGMRKLLSVLTETNNIQKFVGIYQDYFFFSSNSGKIWKIFDFKNK